MKFILPAQVRIHGVTPQIVNVNKDADMNNRSRSILAMACALVITGACKSLSIAVTAVPTEAIPLPTASAAAPPAFINDTTPSPTDISIPPNDAPSPTLTGPFIQHFAVGDQIDITSIQMITASHGWAVGGQDEKSDHVFTTQDGGATWRDVTPPEPVSNSDSDISALGFFRDTTAAWVIYGAPYGSPLDISAIRIWRTADAGATWEYSSAPAPERMEAFVPNFLTFADAQHGWLMAILGAGMMHQYVAIYSTVDGGVTWNKILDPSSDADIQSFPKTGLVFSDAQNGWLTRDAQGVEDSPHVFRTVDGGAAWSRIDLPTPTDKPTLFADYACGTYAPNLFPSGILVVAMKCMDKASYQKQLNFQYVSNDNGQTWTALALPADYEIGDWSSLYYFDANNGFAFGRNIYQTSDGGKTWTFVRQVNWDGQFTFINQTVGWAVARADSNIALVSTTNGGANWNIVKPFVVAP